MPAPDKPKSGDSHRVIRMKEGHIMAVVADGWGGVACDWKAAETAVAYITAIFETASAVNKEKLLAAVQGAAQSVRGIYGICAGAKTSLSVLYVEENGLYRLINIGHAMVLVNRQEVLIAEIDTGQSDAVLGEEIAPIEIVEGQATKWAILTSGILKHEIRHFHADFSNLFRSEQPGKLFIDLIKNYKVGLTDDLTAVLIWI